LGETKAAGAAGGGKGDQRKMSPQSAADRAEYKREWAKKNRERLKERLREYYERHKEGLKAAAKAYHRAKRQHVPEAELERLRLPENRLEALAYGPDKKQQVCLNCGAMFEGNFSRHPSACLVKPQSSDAYREQWGYAKSNSLASAAWHQRASDSRKNSPRFKAAQERNRTAALAAFAAERQRKSDARKEGKPIRCGPLRAEAIARRKQRGFRPRRLRRSVSEDRRWEILAMNLPLDEAAKRAGMSPTALYLWGRRRGYRWPDRRGEDQKIIIKYLRKLTDHVRSMHPRPSAGQISAWLTSSGSDSVFRAFEPYLPDFVAELTERPQWIRDLANAQDNRAVMGLMARILLKRKVRLAAATVSENAVGEARKTHSSPRKSREQRENYRLTKAVRGLLPKCLEGLQIRRRAQAEWPTERVRWESALRKAGFTAQADIDALIASKTAAGAAQRIVAKRTGLTFRGVRNAYSACKELIS
jgi:hypothetical protein